jgi:hypothetical protein
MIKLLQSNPEFALLLFPILVVMALAITTISDNITANRMFSDCIKYTNDVSSCKEVLK